MYDAEGTPIGMQYRNSAYPADLFGAYWFEKNLQGDIVAVYDAVGTKLITYTYDAWGNFKTTYHNGCTAASAANYNPFRYRGYYYDSELGMYYLQSRYYDPVIGRFINADNQLSTSDMTGLNLFAYCGNNPVNRIDPTGEAWWHWALGAAVVAACAVATVVTCGGFAAAATAVCMVGSGVAAATTASTIAAGAFIGSATVYGMAVLSAASTSNSVQEFNDQGNWGTVAATAFGGLTGGYDGYTMSKAQTPYVTSNTGNSGNTSNMKYPGNDPTKCDIPGFEWRGSGTPISGHGNYVNMQTGEWLHPDLNHEPSIGPHWDYGVRGSSQTFRIFPDGSMSPK